MSKLKNISILILLIMFAFVLIPFSFAGDFNDTAIGEEIVSEGIPGEDEAWIELDEDNYVVDEDDNTVIEGNVHIDIIDNPYPWELNVQCNYTDFDGVSRSYNSFYEYESFSFNTADFEGLKARETPYLLTFSVIKDAYFDQFVDDYYIDNIVSETVNLTVREVKDYGVSLPDYETFTPKGQIYVAENGSDANIGSESSPYATIQKALDRNKALGGGYEVIVNKGLYFFTKSYTISNNVRITGKGEVEVINAGTSDGYMFFTMGPNIIEFVNIKMTGGTAGAISGSATVVGNHYANEGKVLNIINCTFEDNNGYVGAIATYSKTTILQSTFIHNKANGIEGFFRGIISARDNSLTVNFCNFIENTLTEGNPLIYSEVKVYANNNFWGTNDGPSAEDIIAPKINLNKWTVIVPQINSDNVVKGNNYTFDVKFMYTDFNSTLGDLNASMPDLNIKLNAKIGEINSSSTIISNIASLNYYAAARDLENITVKVNNNLINYITFNVDVAETDKIYVSPMGTDTNSGNETNPLKTIKAAIDKNIALGGDKVIILAPGTYNEYNITISNNVRIIGGEGVLINAGKKGYIFLVNADADIFNVTFTNSSCAIHQALGSLEIYNCIFDSNFGGAIKSEDVLSIFNSKFTNNINGPAISSNSTLVVKNSKFVNNKDGGINVGYDADIIDNTFINNIATNGGAIYLNASNQASILIKNNKFASNQAINGGAIYCGLTFITIVDNNIFNENTASNGGAIYLDGFESQNRIVSNRFDSNSRYSININDANVDLLNNTITDLDAQINLNSGVIGNVILIFNNNQTLKLKDGDIQLNATVSDDMGNLINGGSILFTINGEDNGTANVINGHAILVKHLDTGNYDISGSYSASNDIYPPLKIENSLIKINTFNYWFINGVGYETLQEAIDAAEINDVIQGIPGDYNISDIQIGHRYRPGEPWVINKNITITSLGNAPVIIKSIDGDIFNIDYYSNVTFKNIVFTGANNPNGWGGAVHSMGKNIITVENCTFMNNVAEKGAALFIYGDLFVKDCLFVNNTATVYGGAIVKDGDGNFFIENSKFINNSAFTYSGAVDCRGYSEVIQVFKNITFEGNTATCAGALYTSGKNVTFIDCLFNSNKAIDKDSGYSPLGGAVYVHNGQTTFLNTNFTNNYAEGTGGALQLENSVSSVVDSTGRHITIHWGVLENCLIENNVALGDGGAIYTGETFRTHINITNSLIKNNTAANGALFVNLYGFYTIINVTAENNRNTAGSSLVYTQGMYSFPESFYANTNIVNSTFNNNNAERFITTTTIYSSVNITDSQFDNMGMLIYSYEGSICNLTNVREINPKEGNFYSIDNTGTLYLKNNSFANPIYNKANIPTPTFVIICNNQTMTCEIGDSIKLEAVVVDDNGNSIIGKELVFEVGENEINSTFEYNFYVANYTVIKGIQTINAIYNDAGLINLTIKSAVIEGKSNLVIISPDITVYLKLEKFNITLTDIKGNPVSDIKLIINIDGRDYSVDSDLNGVALIDLDLSIGNHPVDIRFEGNDKYTPVNVNSIISVLSTIDSTDLTRGYNSPYDFMATFLDMGGNPLKNTSITFKVNNKEYFVNTDSNGVAKLTKLSPGTYSIISVNPTSLQEVTNKLTVLKRITQNKNLAMDYKDGSKFKFCVIGDDGKAVGAGVIVKVTINGKKINVKTDKKGYGYLLINQIPKKYKVTVEYKGFKVSNIIKVKSVIKAKSLTKKRAKKIKYTATLKTSKGKALKNKKVTFKIKGKTYKAKTNKKGVAKVYLKNLKVGKHKIVVKYLKSKVTKTIRIKR